MSVGQVKIMTMPVRADTISRQLQFGQYMTTPEVAKKMAAYGLPEDFRRVLDPSAGEGELLAAASQRSQEIGLGSPDLLAVEIDPLMASSIYERALPNLNVQIADFLEADLKEMRPTMIIANPPYGGGREYEFFRKCATESLPGTLLVFLVPLGFIDRVSGTTVEVLPGRPLGVTTGHAIVVHRAGEPYEISGVRRKVTTSGEFAVRTGLKLYERGAGMPAQTLETVKEKPYSSLVPRPGWLPCLRTGDVSESGVTLGRLWVNYGPHLASPKEMSRFKGPRLIVRRVPIWSTKRLCAQFTQETALCAGDLLIVQHCTDDVDRLADVAHWINSQEASDALHELRPSVRHRSSFPKISAKDLHSIIAVGEQKGLI